MRRTPGLTLAALLLAASVTAVPVEILNDLSHPLSQSEPPPRPDTRTMPTAAADASVQYQSGDTVNLFCNVGQFKWGTFGGTDCWGWTGPDGTEYALMGVFDGIRIVDATHMVQVGLVPGPQDFCGSARWRDIKSYQHYAYAVSECSGTNAGIMVMDLQYLPDSVHFVGAFPVTNAGARTSHNISIDTVTGYLYAEGTGTAGQAIHILSLANPASPTYVGSFGPANGIHDVFAHNDTVFVAEGTNLSFSLWDLGNKLAPALIRRVNVPASGYVHNIWPTDDREYVVTTEETANKTVKVWDIRDLDNIALVGQYLAPSNLAHNAHLEGDTVYLSHYESGVRVVDITTPETPVEIAQYDTHASETPNFNGCWGVYPHTAGGLIYGSNMDGTLFILQENTVILSDTLRVEEVQAIGGTQVRVDIHVTNSLPLRKIVIPIGYAGDYNMTLDSVSTVGTRTDYFEGKQYSGSDLINSRFAYSLTSSNFGSSPDLDPGSGPVLSLYFQIPEGASGQTNPVSITPFNTIVPSFTNRCIGYLPDTISGSVEVTQATCCTALRGNADGDANDNTNVADLTRLVSYLFQGTAELLCPEEGNVDGDPGENITIADVTHLVNYLFKGGSAPALCP